MRTIERYLWGLTAVTGMVSILLVMAVSPGAPATSPVRVTSRVTWPDARFDQDSLARVIVRQNPFRLDRGTHLPTAPQPEAQPPVPPTPRTRDTEIILRGTIGGAQLEALVEGVPGSRAAKVVRQGDRLGQLTIREVWRDSIHVADSDSSWTIRLTLPWK